MTTKPTPLTVSFNDPEEFLAEIGKDQGLLDRAILRLTVRRRYSNPFVTVSIVATAAVGATIVKLENRVGEAFIGDEKNTGLSAKVQAVLDRITEAAKVAGLEVRAGVYE